MSTDVLSSASDTDDKLSHDGGPRSDVRSDQQNELEHTAQYVCVVFPFIMNY